MAIQLALSTIRQADLPASEAWRLLLPFIRTEDGEVAGLVCDALRSWVWKSLDRRRRDPNLREWVDLLNRVEAFFADRFEKLAVKIEVLADLMHESLAVAELATSDELLRRKHVASIMAALLGNDGGWIERGALMQELGLKPANMTRLMSLLLDVGWIEQTIDGREASYRASAEGMARASAARRETMSRANFVMSEAVDSDAELDHVRHAIASSLVVTGAAAEKSGAAGFRQVWSVRHYSVVTSSKASRSGEFERERGRLEGFGLRGPHAYSPKLALQGAGTW